MTAPIAVFPIIARPTAWQQRDPNRADDPTNMIVLPVIRIERYSDDDDEPDHRRRSRRSRRPANGNLAHRKSRSEQGGSSA